MSTILHDLSASLAEWVAQSQDSVVRVEARRPRAASGLVWSADGVVLTASHVIQREDKINVTLPDGAVLPATLIGKDASTDLVALRIAATGLPVLPRAGMQNLAVGHLALGLGRPGQKIQATYGPIGALGEKWRTPWGGVLDVFLRTEIDLPPGFSGGPLLNTQGELLGMNSAALSRHLNLAVPVGTLQRVTGELLQYGRVRRGYLGIGVQPVDLSPALQQQLGQESGLLIVSIAPGSPAEQFGMLVGDTIVACDDQPVVQMDQLLAGLQGDRIHQELTLGLVRGGQLQSLKIIVSENL